MRRFQEENINTALQNIDPEESSTAIIYACMLRKMGKNIEFQDVLDRTFESCIATLTDADGENDQASLLLLAKVLACVGGLDRDARIAYSAQYSILDLSIAMEGGQGVEGLLPWENDGGVERETVDGESASEADIKADGDSESEDERNEKQKRYRYKSHALWGDILPSDYERCQGNRKDHDIRHWKMGPTYLCIICTDVQLCEECFQKMERYNRDENAWDNVNDWKRFCGPSHRYIKGPIEGWKGVRDGVITIEHEDQTEKVAFKDWLMELRDNKWKAAWEDFWRREDAIVNLLE